jgi:hypothetical protein
MKPHHHSGEIKISDELAARCDGPDQFNAFDRGVRVFLAVPNSAVLKDEAKAKRRKKQGPKSKRS